MSGAFETYAAPWYLVGGAGEVYAATMYVLGGLGLGLGMARSRPGWRIQMGVLLALTAMWAAALAGFLSDNGVGHECTAADHTGEWPSLLVTLAWAGALAAALARPDPPVTRLAVRLGLPVAHPGRDRRDGRRARQPPGGGVLGHRGLMTGTRCAAATVSGMRQ